MHHLKYSNTRINYYIPTFNANRYLVPKGVTNDTLVNVNTKLQMETQMSCKNRSKYTKHSVGTLFISR